VASKEGEFGSEIALYVTANVYGFFVVEYVIWCINLSFE
jgi:hypothetical protein